MPERLWNLKSKYELKTERTNDNTKRKTNKISLDKLISCFMSNPNTITKKAKTKVKIETTKIPLDKSFKPKIPFSVLGS